MLGHRQSDAGNIHFLKCVAAQNFARHIARDADHRNRIQHRGGNAGDQIRRAWSAGGDANAHLARSARVAVGHVRRALLMPHQRVVYGKLAQRVIDGQNGAARIAEDVRDALAHQRGPHNLRAGQARGRLILCLRVISHDDLLCSRPPAFAREGMKLWVPHPRRVLVFAARVGCHEPNTHRR